MEIQEQPIQLNPNVSQPGQIAHFKELITGAGSNIFKANAEGLFIGGNSYTDAPIGFDYSGNMKVREGGTIQVGATTIIDDEGLSSSNNFLFAGASSASTQTTTSTSFVDLSGSSLAALTTTRTRYGLLFFSYFGKNSGFLDNGYGVEVQLYDSFSGGGIMNDFIYGENVEAVSWDTGTGLVTSTTERSASITTTQIYIFTILAGTHNYKLRHRAVSGGTATCGAFGLGYFTFGV